MTTRQFFIIGTIFLFGCGTRKTQSTDNDNSDTKTEVPIVEDAWMNFDKTEQVSYVDLYKYGRLKLPGQWKHSDSQPPRYFRYENSENHMLMLDIGRLDTMNFYSKRMDKVELLTKLYEQGIALLREEESGQILTIEKNQDNAIAKLTIDSTKQVFFLCGVKDDKTMTLYLVPKIPNDLKSVDLLKKVYSDWKK